MGKTAKAQKKVKFTIDYPETGEVIAGDHYAVRISGPQGEEVEISIDDGDWALCRNEAGHWWFDLQHLSYGEHRLAARMIKDGDIGISMRKFKVSRK